LVLQQKEWYNFFLEEGVEFSRVSDPQGADRPHYVASVRVVAPRVSKEGALPPDLKARMPGSPGRRQPEPCSPASAAGFVYSKAVVKFRDNLINLGQYSRWAHVCSPPPPW
jgi:hypothetical protein